jgi:uncharacterized membrane protein
VDREPVISAGETLMKKRPLELPTAAGATRAAFVVGVALSGFFDGILLHQVLQWHHLLSLGPGETFRDLRMQVYADGLFHVAVYAVAVVGLFLLWLARRDLIRPGATQRLIGGALLGFGAWNIVDVGFFHWILGIHRIRVNVPNPMAYDLAWILVLGVAVSWIGLRSIRGAGGGSGGGPGRAAAVGLAATLVGAVVIGNLPAAGASTLIVFRPDVGPARAINAIVGAGGAIVMIDPNGGYAVVRLARETSALPLYRAGALLVTRSPALAGCLAYLRRA